MDLDKGAGDDAVWIMTLHSAKGLEFPLVFLPGWEEGVFPSQRSMDDKGEKGLEEERRLAYVGITRAREEARISFVANRQVYGRWTSQLPSRFVDELPLAHVDAASETGYYGGGPGMQQTVASRWDEPANTFTAGSYDSPGWKRAQDRASGFGEKGSTWRAGGSAARSAPIEGEGRLVAVSASSAASDYTRGDRVFHVKFGYGKVTSVEGNKLSVAFDKAGDKKVIDSFVEKA
jgi:DNA helicase-2/ATP-dependent DNA helicase PcrA